MKYFKNFFKGKNRATTAEYGLLISLIALLVVTVITGINKSSATSSLITIRLDQ